jgi:GNAT superfamily N-acetyltransferase
MPEIRPLAEADIDPVAELHVRAWRAGYAGIVPAAVLDALDPAAFAAARRDRPVPPGALTLVAVEDSTIVGFASHGPYRVQQRPEEFDPEAAELYAVYVDPDRWGAGTGRALLAEVTRALRVVGCPELRLWVFEANDRARRFYERAGMAPDGTRHTYTPGGSTAELPEIRYAVRL